MFVVAEPLGWAFDLPWSEVAPRAPFGLTVRRREFGKPCENRAMYRRAIFPVCIARSPTKRREHGVQDGYRRAFVVSPPDLVTVIWYRKTPGTPSDPIQRAVESPIVLKNDVVVGSGWAYYDQVRTQLNLPEVPKS